MVSDFNDLYYLILRKSSVKLRKGVNNFKNFFYSVI